MRLGRDDLVEMDDVRVVESAVVVQLACEVWCKGLWHFFNGCARAGEPVGGEMHRAISACRDISKASSAQRERYLGR